MASWYDVVIVGAGPAGGAAAYHCAAAGLSTLLVDRKPFPRVKVCGDGLTPRALRALARMQVHDIPEKGMRIEGIRLIRDGKAATLPYCEDPSPFNFGAVIPRRILDDEIRRSAESAGAEFWGATSASELQYDGENAVSGVWISTSMRRMLCSAKLTILADGAHGRLTRKLHGDVATSRPFRGTAVRQYVTHVDRLEPYFEIHPIALSDGSLLEGYAWIFPVSAGTANVGVGVLNGRNPGELESFTSLFSNFLDRLIATDPRFYRAEPVGLVEGGTLATTMSDPAALPRGVVCAGDAAGLVNPFTGEGIAAALESGELAAQAAIRAVRNSTGATYRRSLIRSYGPYWRLRESPRHLAWLLSVLPPDSRPAGRVLPALLALARDEAPPPTPGVALLVAGIDPIADSMVRYLRREIARRLKRTDAVLAELGRLLCSPATSPAIWPLIVAGQITSRPIRDPIVKRGFLALALSSLARSILEEPVDAAGAGSRNTLAIMVGDCLLTEAGATASHLPQPVYRQVVAVSLAAARALLVESSTSRMFDHIPAFNESRATAEAAARLVLDCEDKPSAKRASVLRCVGWCAETVEMLFRCESDPTNISLAEQLGAQLGSEAADPDLPLRLTAMVQAVRDLGSGSHRDRATRYRSA